MSGGCGAHQPFCIVLIKASVDHNFFCRSWLSLQERDSYVICPEIVNTLLYADEELWTCIVGYRQVPSAWHTFELFGIIIQSALLRCSLIFFRSPFYIIFVLDPIRIQFQPRESTWLILLIYNRWVHWAVGFNVSKEISCWHS